MYAIKHSTITRIPDAVIFPIREDRVIQLVQLALKCNVSLIPFGGGTNVSEALECPYEDTRMIISVDLRRMNKIK